MNTVVLPENTILVSTLRHMQPLLSISPHLPNVRVHSHVSLFSRKLWASKVMYRGSAAEFLVVLCKPGNPTTNAAQKVTTHIKTTFFGLVACRRLSASEGAPEGF